MELCRESVIGCLAEGAIDGAVCLLFGCQVLQCMGRLGGRSCGDRARGAQGQ